VSVLDEGFEIILIVFNRASDLKIAFVIGFYLFLHIGLLLWLYDKTIKSED